MPLIRRLPTRQDVKMLCRALKVPRSSYYASLNRKPSKRSIENQAIKEKIAEIYEQSKKRYGCIKIKHALEKYGVHISQNRVVRLMRQMGIRSVIWYKYRHRIREKDTVVRPNLRKRQFDAEKPNQVSE